jgi:Amt family ammonium transporter
MEGTVFSVWFLIGAALVFFMQCGFAMVETGFTRAKNASNIIMKNLMDFCIGTVVFMLLGFSLMMSQNYFFGVVGIPDFQIFTNFAKFDFSSFVFTSCSAPLRLRLFPERWRNEPNFQRIAFTAP